MSDFTSVTPAVRVHAGSAALQQLPREAGRLGVQSAFVLCGHSVATRTPLLSRIRDLLGDAYAGACTTLGKDAPVEQVMEAAQQAKTCGADLLIAVGAGSVLKAARVVAILMAEGNDAVIKATAYTDGGEPVSPRFKQPKIPIFNILTAATSAQNRAGAALRRVDGGPRLEFFDPKTRPAAIFWDDEALMTAPPSLVRSTGLGVYWRALMNMGTVQQANPLVQASRYHAFTLSRGAMEHMAATQGCDAKFRQDLCAAALLQNRDEDDGGRPFDAHLIASAVYALAAALFNRFGHLDQGGTQALLTAPAIRLLGSAAPSAVRGVGHALCLGSDATMDHVADEVQRLMLAWGAPARLEGVDVSAREIDMLLEATLCNFNANRGFVLQQHRERLVEIVRSVSA